MRTHRSNIESTSTSSSHHVNTDADAMAQRMSALTRQFEAQLERF
jgi:hypothetical protein